MMMLRGFLPLIAIWLLGYLVDWEAALLTGLGLAGVIAANGALRGKFRSFELAVFVILAALAVFDLVFGRAPGVWPGTVIYAGLAVFAAGSVVVGRPFTLAYGRERVHPDTWSAPGFPPVHRKISLVWSLAFGFLALVLAGAMFLPPFLHVATAVIVFATIAAGCLYSEEQFVRIPGRARSAPD